MSVELELNSIRRSLRAANRTRRRSVTEAIEESMTTNVDPDDVFFSKLILNLLSDFSETYSEYSLLNRLAHEPLLEGPWFAELREIMNEAIKNEKTLMGVSVIRSIVGRQEVAGIIRKIFKANPHLKQKPKPRETSLTLGELLDLTELEILMLDAACRYPEMDYQIRSLFDNIDSSEGRRGLLFHAGILSKDGTSPPMVCGAFNGDLEDVFSNKNMKIEDIDRRCSRTCSRPT
jgi:hypothetical protein